MTTYVLTCWDRPGALETRLATRPAHLAYLGERRDRVKLGGALLDDAGGVIGSLLIIEAESVAEVEALAAGDPYALAGVFERTEIRPWRLVIGTLA
jgi:uncharacterized protein YciI